MNLNSIDYLSFYFASIVMSREFGYMLRAWQDNDLVPSYLSSFIITNLVVFEFRVTFPHEGEGNESNDDD